MGTPGAAGGQKGSINSHASKQAILKVKIGNVVSFVIRIVTPVVFFIVLIFCPFSGAFEGSAGVEKGPNTVKKRSDTPKTLIHSWKLVLLYVLSSEYRFQ